MVEPLKLQAGAFAQDSHPWRAPQAGHPGCRRLDGMGVATLRHRGGSEVARELVTAQGLPWPEHTGEMVGDVSGTGVLLMRRQPEEVVVIAPSTHPTLSELSAEIGRAHV